MVAREQWAEFPSRVYQNTCRLLDLFAEVDVKATFFVLGWVAERFPDLVKEIQDAGHEIGSHSYSHQLIFDMQQEDFRTDLRRSKDILEQITGCEVTTFRAPSFSITNDSKWALDILVQEGFRFDSSIFPTHHDRYGIPDAKKEIHEITTDSGALFEFPMSVSRLMGLVNLPVSGGGYFRLYPYALSKRLLRSINRERPFMFYLHPWEVDPDQPEITGVPYLARKRHRVNLDKTLDKLKKLLNDFEFSTMTDVMSQHLDLQPSSPPELCQV